MSTQVSDEKVAALWQAWHVSRDGSVKQELLVAYLPFVRKIAAKLLTGLVHVIFDSDDLCSYGAIGLITAIDKYSPDRGCHFTTFAASRVRGAMLDGIREMDHLSRSHRAAVKAQQCEPVWVCHLSDELASRVAKSDVEFDGLDFWRTMLRGLSRQERLLLLMYYKEGRTMKEIGQSLGLCESRVSQLHTYLVGWLRKHRAEAA